MFVFYASTQNIGTTAICNAKSAQPNKFTISKTKFVHIALQLILILMGTIALSAQIICFIIQPYTSVPNVLKEKYIIQKT